MKMVQKRGDSRGNICAIYEVLILSLKEPHTSPPKNKPFGHERRLKILLGGYGDLTLAH
jgi:hypothetical protein